MPDELDPDAFYFWFFKDERTGKRRRTGWRMTPAAAAANNDLPQPLEADLASKELRTYLGNAADIGRASVSPASALPPTARPPEFPNG